MGMDPVTASIVGPIAGSAIGGILGNKSAKTQANAINAANAASNMGYTDARPYITNAYSRGRTALDNILAQGPYTGQTYARMNPLAQQAYQNLGDAGTTASADAPTFMNLGRGFAQNYVDLYNRASQDMMANGISYATDPSNYQGLVDAATRDARRNLEENTLRGIDVAGSMSGNTNSSRTGVADAIAARGFADREADMRATIQDNLLNRSLTQQQQQLSNMTSANQNLGALYNTGVQQAATGAGMMTSAGGAMQSEQQRQLNDDRARYENERDFEMDAINNYMSGILGQAPRTPSQQRVNSVDPLMATIGGMGAGFGIGGKLGNMLSFTQPTAIPQAAPVYNSMLAQNPALGGRFYGF